MREYYKIMLGSKSMYANECYKNGFVGADYGIEADLTNELPDDWRQFNHKFIPKYLAKYPEKSKITAGLACGSLWTVCKAMNIGDVVLSPNGHGKFLVVEVLSEYKYQPGGILPHRRIVKWYSTTISRSEVSQEFRNSTNSPGTSVALKTMADYVNYMSDGDRSIIPTTGYEPSKDTRTPVVIAPVKGFAIEYGDNPGTINLSVKKGAGVLSAVFQFTLDATIDGSTAWQGNTCAESTCTLTNLPVGKMVWLRDGAVGPRRQQVFNQPIQKMVA